MQKVSIIVVGAGAVLVIISFVIGKPKSNEGYWTDEQQQTLDEARNRAHHLSDHHGDASKEGEYKQALVKFEAEREKLDSARSRSVLAPRIFRWLGIAVAAAGSVALVVGFVRQQQ